MRKHTDPFFLQVSGLPVLFGSTTVAVDSVTGIRPRAITEALGRNEPRSQGAHQRHV